MFKRKLGTKMKSFEVDSMYACPRLLTLRSKSFPYVVVLGADLNLDANNWHWVLYLTLPLETLDVLQFSPRPYTEWIRYVIGIVIGAEGDLSSSPGKLAQYCGLQRWPPSQFRRFILLIHQRRREAKIVPGRS